MCSWAIDGKPLKDSLGPLSPFFPLHVITISLNRLSTSYWVIISSLPAHSGHPTADSQQKGRRHPLQQNNSLGVLEESDPLHALVYVFGKERLSSPQSLNSNRLLHKKHHISSGERLFVARRQKGALLSSLFSTAYMQHISGVLSAYLSVVSVQLLS